MMMQEVLVKKDDETKVNEIVEIIKTLENEEIAEMIGYAKCLPVIRIIRKQQQSSA